MILVLLFILLGTASAAELPPPSTTKVDFARDIEPVLRRSCYACHGPQQQMSGLRLDRGEDALRGGYSGAVIQPGRSAESKLIRLVAGIEGGKVMPPAGPRLTPAEIGLLRAWIDQGAVRPASTLGAESKAVRRSSHWAFQPVRRPSPPAVTRTDWVRNDIDRFVLARLEAEKIPPSPEADRTTLIRRLSLDLIGLPPAPAEVREFLADTRPDAYERLVDRLLASSHYGERWARPWLDVARYADSDGYEKDWARPHAWRYRHWAIDALNRDMPFDEFTVEQIAGDLMPGASVDQKVATGFHRNTLTNREGGVDINQFRFEAAIDRTNTVATAWLGLTAGCAQCHDHKYDPISQKEYYQLFAFFQNLEEKDIDAPLPGEMGPYLASRPEYDKKRQELLDQYHVPQLQAEWEKRLKEAAANPGKWTDWDLAYDVLQKLSDGGDRYLMIDPGKRTQEEKDVLTDHFVEYYHFAVGSKTYEDLKFKELNQKLRELKKSYPALSRAQSVSESRTPEKCHLRVRGDYRALGVEVQPDTPAVLPPMPKDVPRSRLALARWIVSPENPLTARVMVNRMWQEFFGRGLVLTSENLGSQGDKPSHPELLEWLAAEFMDRGWSVKQMHRLMVTSATYRQRSTARPELQERDPNNALLARQTRLRLGAEAIRDEALSASGLLYPAVGGKSIRPPQPASVASLGYADMVKWEETQGPERYRRGLYIFFQRTTPYPQLTNFDAPDANVTHCRRERSNTPLQALNLLNDPVFFEASQALAERVLRESSAADFEARLSYMFRLCYGRDPKPSEAATLRTYLDNRLRRLRSDPGRARSVFPVHVEQADTAELAAWTGLSRVLINSDEFISRN
jgi:mono/diheme cytochrome c family protein